MRRVCLLAIFIACCIVPAWAQEEYHKVEGSIGYSHNRVDTGLDDDDFEDFINNREGFNGFNASIKGNFSRYVGLKGEYAFHRRSFSESNVFDADFDLHTFVGGVEIKDNSKTKKVKPFAHLMAGLTRARFSASDGIDSFDESDTGFSAVIGGGVDVRVGKRVDIRVIQLDYNPMRFSFNGGGSQTLHNFRIGFGVVFH